MSCRNRGCRCNRENWGNFGSGCRRTGRFTSTVPVTVTYQITPNMNDERAIIDRINNAAGDCDRGNDRSDSSRGCD